MKITRIKFPASWEGRNSQGSWVVRKLDAEFKLGPGPCGKTVARLDVEVDETSLRVGQQHDDGTAMSFLYQLRDVLGRVEIESEPS